MASDGSATPGGTRRVTAGRVIAAVVGVGVGGVGVGVFVVPDAVTQVDPGSLGGASVGDDERMFGPAINFMDPPAGKPSAYVGPMPPSGYPGVTLVAVGNEAAGPCAGRTDVNRTDLGHDIYAAAPGTFEGSGTGCTTIPLHLRFDRPVHHVLVYLILAPRGGATWPPRFSMTPDPPGSTAPGPVDAPGTVYQNGQDTSPAPYTLFFSLDLTGSATTGVTLRSYPTAQGSAAFPILVEGINID